METNVQNYLSRLATLNDPLFKFDPAQHQYTYNGKVYTSVTTFLKNFHEPFDNAKWSKIKAEQRGISVDEIQAEWLAKNLRANVVGTGMHDWIENFFKQQWVPLPTDLDIIARINKFNLIYAQHLHKLIPLKFEQRVFSKKYPLAGTLDSLFLYKDSLIIFDWKSNGVFTHDNHPKGKYQKLLSPLEDYYQNHLNEYSIQVSLYAEILAEWGIEVKMCYLLHIGPDTEPQIYRAHNFREILRPWLESYFSVK